MSNYSTIEERFWAKVNKDAPGDCWLWTAGAFTNGYGCFSLEGKLWKAHRAAWKLFKGQIPEGLCVLHSCDTPRCVNHEKCLFLGTHKINSEDRDKKGRWVGHTKTNPAVVRCVREDCRVAMMSPVIENGKPRPRPREQLPNGFIAEMMGKYSLTRGQFAWAAQNKNAWRRVANTVGQLSLFEVEG